VPNQLDYPTDRRARPSSIEEPRERSLAIGILCTVIVHVLLFVIAPFFPAESLTGTHSNLDAIAANRAKNFDFELEPAATAPEKQPDPFKFVETNPDAPENEPDKTANFSNRNQQSAQAEAAKEIDPENRPSIKGREDIQNDSAIVSGDMAQPQAGAAVTPPQAQTSEAEPQTGQQARAEQIPLSGFDKTEGNDPDGIATNKSDNKSASTNADQFVEGAKEGKSETGGLTVAEQTARPTPKPRPRLTQSRPTILANRITGTSNIGVLGIDARWSEYGEYMQELIEIIQAQWYSILERSAIAPKSGSRVIVTFKLTADGETSVVNVDETAGKPGTYACLNAISERQPYRKWTDQMIAVLGREQTITFSFYYW